MRHVGRILLQTMLDSVRMYAWHLLPATCQRVLPCIASYITKNFTMYCRLHYKEYLVGLVNKHSLDPLAIMSTDQLELQLKKNEKPQLKKKNKESTSVYRKRLIAVSIQSNLP